MFFRNSLNKGGFVANPIDLLQIAHDTLVGGKIVPEVVGL